MPIGLNEVLDRGVSSAVQRRLGLSSQATLSLMPELAVTLDLGLQPEILYNLGWRRFGHSLSMAQVAAQRDHSRFRVVPNVGAPVIVVLERLLVEGNGGNQFVHVDILGTVTSDLANPFPNHQGLDFRQRNPGGSFTSGSNVILSTAVDGTASTLGVYFSGSVPSGAYTTIPVDGICLTNGQGVEVDFDTLNANAIVTWIWRERMSNDAEVAI